MEHHIFVSFILFCGRLGFPAMIDLALVKERMDATPFRPFRLETTGGKQIQIVTRDHLLFAPESRDLIIAFEPGGNMHLLSTDQLASLEVEMPGE